MQPRHPLLVAGRRWPHGVGSCSADLDPLLMLAAVVISTEVALLGALRQLLARQRAEFRRHGRS